MLDVTSGVPSPVVVRSPPRETGLPVGRRAEVVGTGLGVVDSRTVARPDSPPEGVGGS